MPQVTFSMSSSLPHNILAKYLYFRLMNLSIVLCKVLTRNLVRHFKEFAFIIYICNIIKDSQIHFKDIKRANFKDNTIRIFK